MTQTLRLDGPNVARPPHLTQLLAAGAGRALLARGNSQRLAARRQRLDELRHALRRREDRRQVGAALRHHCRQLHALEQVVA